MEDLQRLTAVSGRAYAVDDGLRAIVRFIEARRILHERDQAELQTIVRRLDDQVKTTDATGAATQT